jgi:hypothetical protein
MTLSRELLVKVIGSVRGDPEKSAALIKDLESIRVKMENRKRKIEEIKKDADSKIKKLMGEIICTHEFTKVSYDPSGGSDIEETCLVCGESGRFP